MNMTDPIADMLTRIRNGMQAKMETVDVVPVSKVKVELARILKEEGYISDFAVLEDGAKRILSVTVKYYQGAPVIEGIQRVSKPSCRIHCTCKDIPKVLGGLGTVVLSTPNGILSGRKAKEANVGGEVLLYVW